MTNEHEEAVRLAEKFGASVATPLHGAHGVVKYPGSITMQYEQLAALIADVRSSAWQEGYLQGIEDERISNDNIGIAGFGAKVGPARENPYAIRARLEEGK